jgi:hypothetical protein
VPKIPGAQQHSLADSIISGEIGDKEFICIIRRLA